ncbi:hypothetical protein VNI00_014540 [Paramarasmius palmivorus]|uniref:Uncharacterized protein n=1 Tax=Paramarasmius palmivorus TaxID=297713 RepID=A0AAW0BTS4_9AGAR
MSSVSAPKGAGRKPKRQKASVNSPSEAASGPADSAPSAPDTVHAQKDPSSLPAIPTVPRQHNTRAKNKDIHPGNAHHAYTQTRRPSAVVAAEREEQEKQAVEVERKRLEACNRLAALEDEVQAEMKELTTNFAKPARSVPPLVSKPPTSKKKKSDIQAERDALLKRLDELNDRAVSDDEIEVFSSREDNLSEDETNLARVQHNSDEDDTTERPKDPEVDSDDVVELVQDQTQTKSRGRKVPRTSRAEVNELRSNPATSGSNPTSTPTVTTSTAASTTSSQPPTAKSLKKRKKRPASATDSRSKKAKTNELSPSAHPTSAFPSGLKKITKPKKQVIINEAEESMLREGQSVGFDDNHTAELGERQLLQGNSEGAKIPIKIEEKPLQLPVGKAARNDGEKRFTSKHLPEFILKAGGDRKIFTPLVKEAAGYIHSWCPLKKSLVESVVKRGFGKEVTLAESGKDAVSVVANQKVVNLRHELATGATDIVQDYIKAHWTTRPPPQDEDEETEWVFRTEGDVAEWAKYMTRKFSIPPSTVQLSPMHFADFEVDGDTGEVLLRQGMFQHELLLRTLAIYFAHVDSIPQNIKRYDIDDDGKPRYPFGALEMSIQALERALTLFHTGKLVPCGDFSYLNWGAIGVLDSRGNTTKFLRHDEFHSTIKRLTADRWKAIIEGAKQYMKPKRGATPSKPAKKRSLPKEEVDEDSGDGDDELDIMMSDPPEPLEVVVPAVAAGQGPKGIIQVLEAQEALPPAGLNGQVSMEVTEDGDGEEDANEGSEIDSEVAVGDD